MIPKHLWYDLIEILVSSVNISEEKNFSFEVLKCEMCQNKQPQKFYQHNAFVFNVEFCKGAVSQSGVSVWQHTLVG